ncbi:hypothetical protein [Rhodanobacter sp. Root179]|uniref:hypothetical protein n=1 Tax=Rhodanobacter sp. Root179 TaxID=1736482 RepID=UPI0012FA11E5|nr:hypothetical protein [Rhodanobacter sp. Root179]
MKAATVSNYGQIILLDFYDNARFLRLREPSFDGSVVLPGYSLEANRRVNGFFAEVKSVHGLSALFGVCSRETDLAADFESPSFKRDCVVLINGDSYDSSDLSYGFRFFGNVCRRRFSIIKNDDLVFDFEYRPRIFREILSRRPGEHADFFSYLVNWAVMMRRKAIG